MASKALTIREEGGLFQGGPLLGGHLDRRFLEMSQQILPPLHRKVKPDGRVDFRMHSDSKKGTSWVFYFALRTIMERVIDQHKITCSFAFGSEGTSLPAEGKC